jgi:hypothetical protein
MDDGLSVIKLQATAINSLLPRTGGIRNRRCKSGLAALILPDSPRIVTSRNLWSRVYTRFHRPAHIRVRATFGGDKIELIGKDRSLTDGNLISEPTISFIVISNPLTRPVDDRDYRRGSDWRCDHAHHQLISLKFRFGHVLILRSTATTRRTVVSSALIGSREQMAPCGPKKWPAASEAKR